MKKGWFIIAAVVAIAAIAVLLLFYKQQRTFDGRITLDPKHKIPYGTFVAYNLLPQQFPKSKVEINKEAPGEWKLPQNDTIGTALLIVISYFNPTEEELNELTVFAQKGNYVFISALQMSERAQSFFKVLENDVYSPYGISQNNGAVNILDSFTVTLDTAQFTPPVSFSYPGIGYDNQFMASDSLYTYALGAGNKNRKNLLAIKTDKGAFFLHSAPITFTNFFLLYRNNHLYFEKLMGLLPAGTKHILWDEYFMYHRYRNEDDSDNGVFSVLLTYENFRWAFWLTLIGIGLYTITEIKRRQRYVPEHTPPANDTLTFVSTIGKLYYEKGDHKNLAEKLSLYFLDFIRNRYKMSTTEINANFAKAVALKSNVPVEEITAITNALVQIKLSDTITQQQLLDYYKMLEQFYSKV